MLLGPPTDRSITHILRVTRTITAALTLTLTRAVAIIRHRAVMMGFALTQDNFLFYETSTFFRYVF